MKKFAVYFLIFFAVILAILNARFIFAEVKFTLRGANDIAPVTDSDSKTTYNLLPVVQSREYFLIIPSIGVKAPIVLEKSTDTDAIFNRLEDGVVHYAGSPLPGEKGASIILGHSSAYPWYEGKYGSVFALLSHLKVGDEFQIVNGNKILKYKISESLVFNPFATKDKRLTQLEQTDNSSVVLVSCWPVGTNYKRIAVKAELN